MQHSEFYGAPSNYLPIPSFPIIISPLAERIAEQLAGESPPTRHQHVYQNALAVFTVSQYLQSLGLETDTTSTEFSDPLHRSLTNIADVVLSGFGKVECCLVSSEEPLVSIPVESWGDRIAYIAVSLDLDNHQAIVLGFIGNLNIGEMEEANSEDIHLSLFRDIDDFPDYLDGLKFRKHKFEYLRNWLEGIYTGDYQPVFRSIDSASGIKPITLGIYEIDLILTVSNYSETEFQIQIRIRPKDSLGILPDSLEIGILDDEGEALWPPIKATRNSNLIDITLNRKLICEAGDCFLVSLHLNDINVIEKLTV